jgi:hypothetical protein
MKAHNILSSDEGEHLLEEVRRVEVDVRLVEKIIDGVTTEGEVAFVVVWVILCKPMGEVGDTSMEVTDHDDWRIGRTWRIALWPTSEVSRKKCDALVRPRHERSGL